MKKAIKTRVTAFVMAVFMTIPNGSTVLGAEKTAAEIVSGMTLKQKIGQMIMPAFRYWNGSDVTEINASIEKAIEDYDFGGIIVFAQNTKGTEQSARLVDSFQKASEKGGNIPLLIAIDQEGGLVARLGTGTLMPGSMALGAVNDKQTAKDYAEIISSELDALGINVNFAPVMDVNNNPLNPVIGVRSFSSDPNIAADTGSAFIEGLHKNNVAVSLKHFPGHGDTSTDSHSGLPCINKTYDEIKKTELVPFKAGIAADADMIMTAHIQYPLIETEEINGLTLPATLSKKMITDILRTDLGYNGVVVTDALEMDAIAKYFGAEQAAKLAINADVDMLLMPVDMSNAEGIENMGKYIDSIADMVQNGEIDEATITRSAERIVDLKIKRGIINYDTTPIETRVSNAKNIVGSKAHHDKELEISEKAGTLIKNENGTLPVKLKNGEKAVIFSPYDGGVMGLEYGVEMLQREDIIPSGSSVQIFSMENKTFADFEDEVKDAKYIITASSMYALSNIDPAQTAYSKFIDDALEYSKKNGIKSIFFSMRLPYDTARYQNADGILAFYSPKFMSEKPENFNGETPAYGAGWTAAVCDIFGLAVPQGKLPAEVYEVDDNYKLTDKVLYNVGYGLDAAEFYNKTDKQTVNSVKANVTDENGIMFTTGVDSLNYRTVGFIFESDGKEVRRGFDTVYSSIEGSDFLPNDFENAEYIYAFSISDIADTAKKIKVTPYTIDMKGNETRGETEIYSIIDLGGSKTAVMSVSDNTVSGGAIDIKNEKSDGLVSKNDNEENANEQLPITNVL